jgi:hypothetical protein
LIIIKVFSPNDAQLDSLKNNFKLALKFTLKGSYMFRYEKHHTQEAHCLSLAKVAPVRIRLSLILTGATHIYKQGTNNNTCGHTAK